VRRPYDSDDDPSPSASVTGVHHHEERPTCKMTPEQLLGLQRHARHKTLSPEITIDHGDAVPSVIAEGTGESVPIMIELAEPARGSLAEIAPAEPLDHVIAELEAKFTPVPVHPLLRKRLFASRDEAGAFFGFALFGAWTLVEIAMLLAR